MPPWDSDNADYVRPHVGNDAYCHFCTNGGGGVALFLLLSGFGLTKSCEKNGLAKYWWKKVNRILLPYAIIITALILYRDKFNTVDYILNILGIKTSYWYIAYAIKWYLIFWITTKFFYKYRLYIMAVCGVAMVFLLPNIEAEQSFSFLAGVLIATNLDKVKQFSRKTIVLWIIASFAFGTIFLAIKQLPVVRDQMDSWIYIAVQLGIKLPYAITIIGTVALIPKLVANPLLSLAGLISYELYLIHMPFYGEVKGSVTLSLILFVGSFVAAFLFFRFNNLLSHGTNQLRSRLTTC